MSKYNTLTISLSNALINLRLLQRLFLRGSRIPLLMICALFFRFYSCRWILVFPFLAVAMFSDVQLCLGVENVRSTAESAVVRIYNYGDESGTGTGFVINENGNIVTNHHVIENAKFLVVAKVVDDSYRLYQATVLAENAELDLAVLKANLDGVPFVKVFTGELERGDLVQSWGYPGRFDSSKLEGTDESPFGKDVLAMLDTLSKSRARFNDGDPVLFLRGNREFNSTVYLTGEINALRTEWWGNSGTKIRLPKTISHSVDISGGNSGGPLFDAKWNVVGVLTAAIHRDGDKRPLASHAQYLVSFLRTHNIKYYEGSRTLSNSNWMVYFIVGIAVVGGLFWIVFSKLLHASTPGGPAAGGGINVLPGDGSPSELPKVDRPVLKLCVEGSSKGGESITVLKSQLEKCDGYLIIGRDSSFCDFSFSESSVSGQHFGISLQGSKGAFVEDRYSTNGTVFKGTKLEPFVPVSLGAGGRIELGRLSVRVEVLR